MVFLLECFLISEAFLAILSEVLPEDLEKELKEAAQISMGTEVSDEDIENISALCDQVISISEYREQLYDYLKNRMQAIAPNLTILVGELVGARLIAHAGSLLNLAKHPASTVQILGAEKALFRALKTKHETPKYGLIYHASLVGQTPQKYKGKLARVLAAKAALATRLDALGEGETDTQLGTESRMKVELRLKNLEGGQSHRLSGTGKGKEQLSKYEAPKTTVSYNTRVDSTIGTSMEQEEKSKKRKKDEDKSGKEEKKQKVDENVNEQPSDNGERKKKKKRKDREQAEEQEEAQEVSEPAEQTVSETTGEVEKKKKKKKKSKETQE